MILNRPYADRPTELADVGRLRRGTADPDARGFDGRVTVAGDEAVTELRIPWARSDPSSHRVWEPRADGSIGTREVGPLGIELVGGPEVTYDWEGWDAVDWHERRKAGWDAVARAFAAADG